VRNAALQVICVQIDVCCRKGVRWFFAALLPAYVFRECSAMAASVGSSICFGLQLVPRQGSLLVAYCSAVQNCLREYRRTLLLFRLY
jgi:hypothetical protein